MNQEENERELESTGMSILEDLEKMQPEEIDELRSEWFAEHEKDMTANISRYINALCNVAKNRVRSKMEAAQ